MTDVFEAAALLGQREASVDDKVDKILGTATTIRRRSGPTSTAVTTEQAIQSERKPEPEEGARAFGAPLAAPDPRIQERQSTDSNN
jgi:hypothetical protein